MVDNQTPRFVVLESTLEGLEKLLGQDGGTIAVLDYHLVEVGGV